MSTTLAPSSGTGSSTLHDPRLFLLSSYLLDYPFEERLYPGALDVLARFGRLGLTVVLSDGDVVFQPRKIERSGIRRAVEDRVLIRIHKERELGSTCAARRGHRRGPDAQEGRMNQTHRQEPRTGGRVAGVDL
jgi:hypothetical protein